MLRKLLAPVVKIPAAPMLATLAEAPLEHPSLVYEPKYDGIRAIVEVASKAVRIWSRNGNEKTNQFPEIVEALETWIGTQGAKSGAVQPLILDGEIVALDGKGRPLGFQALQGRIHVVRHGHVVGPKRRPSRSGARASGDSDEALVPVAFIAFDVLKEGTIDLRGRTLLERRARLEKLLPKPSASAAPGVLRLSEMVRGDGRALHERAVANGWEGVIAKRADSIYHSGKRTPDWRKIKITHEQEFVIGGWTDPRGMRAGFGSLVLGVWEDSNASRAADSGARASSLGRRGPEKKRALRYAGHVGTGVRRARDRSADGTFQTTLPRGQPVSRDASGERAAALDRATAGRAGTIYRVDGRRPAAAPGVSGPPRRQGCAPGGA